MDEVPLPRPSTGEYIARWRSIVEDHLVEELDGSLRLLVAVEEEIRQDGVEPGSLLAHHVVRALRLAASSTGGVEVAVRYLQQAATARDELPSPGMDPSLST